MGVGVDEAGKDDLAATVDFFGVFREFVAREFVGGADGDDLAVIDEDSAVLDDAEVAHLRPATGRGHRAGSGVARRG